MLRYLIVLLDNTSVSYCHADNPFLERNLMTLDTLRDAIVFGMKQNLMIQFVYPDYTLPEEYITLLDSIDHVNITAHWNKLDKRLRDKSLDVEVLNTPSARVHTYNVIVRMPLQKIIEHAEDIQMMINKVRRLNLCITDVENWKDSSIDDYTKALNKWIMTTTQIILEGSLSQFNIITDRLSLSQMHNCQAGVESITVAPDGSLYLCPAFFYSNQTPVGDIWNGLKIPNPQLLRLDHAPLCQYCDAFHCHRCIWLNMKLTGDVNVPSHQQCVISHLERRASVQLQKNLNINQLQSGNPIPDKDDLDPLYNYLKNNQEI